MTIDPEATCAVIVTFNRRALLAECLRSVLAQTARPRGVIVVDNASTDRTSEFVRSEFPSVHLVAMPQNAGGAGGFAAGMKTAFDQGYAWLWLMDDDTIPSADAFARLQQAYERFDGVKPRILSSRILWTDGALHPWNVPAHKIHDVDLLYYAASKATVSLRTASFVSCLLDRAMIEKYGYPIADYFIWNDDAEYTARILRHELGVLVPDSTVIHKTAKKSNTSMDAGARYFYEVRNKLWMVRCSDAWNARERLEVMAALGHGTARYLAGSRFSLPSLKTVTRGVWSGVFSRPKSNED